MNIRSRLKKLEGNKGNDEPLVIVHQYVEPDGSIEPVEGYETSEQQIIYLKEGETVDEMIKRAIPNRNGRPLVLLPFNNR